MSAIPPDPHALVLIRRTFARQILLRAGVLEDATPASKALQDAFATVPREAFLGPGPWRMAWRGGYRTCPAEADLVYQDVLFALADGGINNGEPSLHASWLSAVAPMAGERALMVGAGSGYYAAILAELLGPKGALLAIEHDARLAAAARVNLAPWSGVKIEHGDGADWPRQPVDIIYVCASCARPAASWLDHLALGGRLVFPLGSAAAKPAANGGRYADAGLGLLITRQAEGFAVRNLGGAWFIMAEGDALNVDAAERERLRTALRRGGLDFVRSLRWRQPPGAQALHIGAGWSLEPHSIPATES